VVFDLDTGRVLWRRDPTRVLPIASLTKMMTALVVTDRVKAGSKVLITKEALHYEAGGSAVGLLPRGKWIGVNTMLYGLMLPSGNDAAIALAQEVSRTVPRFVRLMNRQARRLGLGCTRFSGPDGFDDAGNKSCARDLAVLGRLVLRDSRLRRIVRSQRAVRRFPIKKSHKIWLYNNNTLMRRGYKGVIGVKTGFTNKAGHCLVAAARRGKIELGVVLLHSPDTGDQGSRLLDAGFRAMS
jgi:D-alanyl-D-alanine carboxypeptidase